MELIRHTQQRCGAGWGELRLMNSGQSGRGGFKLARGDRCSSAVFQLPQGCHTPRETLKCCRAAKLHCSGLARLVAVRIGRGEHAEYVLPPFSDRECPVMIAETNAGIPF